MDRGTEQADQLLPSLSSLSGVTSASYYRNRFTQSSAPASLVEENLILQDGENAYLSPDETGNVPLSISLYALDDGEMRRYLQELNLRMEEYTDPEHPRAIVLDHQRYQRDGRYVDGHLFRTQPEQLTLMSYTEEGTSRPTLTLEAACYTDIPPRGLGKYAIGFNHLQIIVSNAIFDIQQEDAADSDHVTICLDSSSPKKTEEEVLKTLKEWDSSDGYSLYNYTSAAESQSSLLLVINVFSYGFITLISLITVANVFNTISTNIQLRRREFAMLQSVGMTGSAFRKMMNFECLFLWIQGASLWAPPYRQRPRC